MKLIILDAGHAEKVAGKEAPDLSFREWKFNNEMQYLLKERLEEHGFHVYLTNPSPAGKDEMGLTARANKANNYWKSKGEPDALFYSIHANAFLNIDSKGRYIQEFTSARGTVTFKAKNASNKTDRAAKIFQEEIIDIMKELDPTGYFTRGVWTENFTVIYKAQMPSILMEYAFYTNKKDLKILKNNKAELVEATVKAFCKYFKVEYKVKEEKNKYLRVLKTVNLHSKADFTKESVCGKTEPGTVLTIVKKIKKSGTNMYLTKAGTYITSSSKYVEVFER